ITKPKSALTNPVSIPPIWASVASGSATLQSQDLNAAPIAERTPGIHYTLMQRSNLEMQQQDKIHHHSYKEDPRLLQTCRHPTLDLQVLTEVRRQRLLWW
ncbi:Hypothetical predicted protein, partial [Marmota monax]